MNYIEEVLDRIFRENIIYYDTNLERKKYINI